MLSMTANYFWPQSSFRIVPTPRFLEKSELMPLMFSESDLELMQGVRAVFDPAGSFNPGKIIPLSKIGVEQPLPGKSVRQKYLSAPNLTG